MKRLLLVMGELETLYQIDIDTLTKIDEFMRDC